MSAVSLKLKYASTAFAAVLLAAFAFICLFAWQLHLHSQHVESLAQAAVHASAPAGAAPAATTAARTATSIELLKRLQLLTQTDLMDGLALAAILAGAAGLVAAWLAWRAACAEQERWPYYNSHTGLRRCQSNPLSHADGWQKERSERGV